MLQRSLKSLYPPILGPQSLLDIMCMHCGCWGQNIPDYSTRGMLFHPLHDVFLTLTKIMLICIIVKVVDTPQHPVGWGGGRSRRATKETGGTATLLQGPPNWARCPTPAQVHCSKNTKSLLFFFVLFFSVVQNRNSVWCLHKLWIMWFSPKALHYNMGCRTAITCWCYLEWLLSWFRHKWKLQVGNYLPIY